MKAATAVLVALVLVATVLVGCFSGPPVSDGTFDHYVTIDGEPQPDKPPTGAEKKSGWYVPRDGEATGRAAVTLEGGLDLLVDCPIRGLKKGDAILVQENDDGTWVVVPATASTRARSGGHQ